MKNYLVLLPLIGGQLLLSNPSWCQEFKNNAAAKEKHFISQVKQLDEFFERFNNDSTSFIRKVYKSYNVKFTVDRKKLIKSLFNYENKSFEQANIDAFVKNASLIRMPSQSNWYGENWFADANCKFQYNGQIIDISIILKTVTDQQKRSKWIIVAVKPNQLKEPTHSQTSITVKTRKTKFIDPSSHGVNFIELERDFEDKHNLSDYFDNQFFYRKNALQFYHAIQMDKIRFLYVNEIKYHFFNVDNIIFTVEQFQRESLNSGWLINSLKFVTPKAKETFRKQLLGDK